MGRADRELRRIACRCASATASSTIVENSAVATSRRPRRVYRRPRQDRDPRDFWRRLPAQARHHSSAIGVRLDQVHQGGVRQGSGAWGNGGEDVRSHAGENRHAFAYDVIAVKCPVPWAIFYPSLRPHLACGRAGVWLGLHNRRPLLGPRGRDRRPSLHHHRSCTLGAASG